MTQRRRRPWSFVRCASRACRRLSMAPAHLDRHETKSRHLDANKKRRGRQDGTRARNKSNCPSWREPSATPTPMNLQHQGEKTSEHERGETKAETKATRKTRSFAGPRESSGPRASSRLSYLAGSPANVITFVLPLLAGPAPRPSRQTLKAG